MLVVWCRHTSKQDVLVPKPGRICTILSVENELQTVWARDMSMANYTLCKYCKQRLQLHELLSGYLLMNRIISLTNKIHSKKSNATSFRVTPKPLIILNFLLLCWWTVCMSRHIYIRREVTLFRHVKWASYLVLVSRKMHSFIEMSDWFVKAQTETH